MRLLGKILLGVFLGAAFSFLPGGGLVFISFLAALYLISRYIRTEARTFLIILFIAGFALRAVLAFANYYVGLNVTHQGVDTQPDAVKYNTNALYVAHLLKGLDYSKETARNPALASGIENEKAWLRGKVLTMGTYQHGFYVHVLSLIYAYLGYCPIAVKMLNGLFGALSAILTYLIAKYLCNSEPVAKISAVVTMFFPSIVYWSATLLRDTIANFAFLAYILSLLIYIKFGIKRSLITVLLSIVLLKLFKENTGPILIAGVGFTLIAGFVRKMLQMKLLIAFILIICILPMPIVMEAASKHSLSNQLKDNMFKAIKHQKGYARIWYASNYKIYKEWLYEKPEWENLSDFTDISLNYSIFKGLAYFFLSPFPWDVPYDHPGLLLFCPQVMLTFIFLPFMLIGFLMSVRRDAWSVLTIVAVLAFFIIPTVLAEGLIGIAVRHRDTFVPFLIIFSSYGFYSLMTPKNISKPQILPEGNSK